MQLSQQTDYALRVLLYTAINRGELVQVSHIVEAYQVPKSNIMKVVAALAKGGFLHSIRGKNGGFQLAKDPKEIRIGDVIQYLEPLNVVECMRPRNKCVITPTCQLIQVLAEANTQYIHSLNRYNLNDLISSGTVNILSRINLSGYTTTANKHSPFK